MEQKRPQVAQTVERAPEFRGGRLDSGLPVLAIEVS
jgi:hypothetical protein